MNNKKQKLVSRIICGALVPFLLFLNCGAAQVAYAAPAANPPAAACPTGFVEDNTHQYCTKANPAAADTCPANFHKFNTLSTDAVLYCEANVTSSTPIDNKAITNGIQVLAGLQKTLNRLIWPVLVLIGGLMENDLLYGNGMEQKLQDIWIPIRNLVNILFVIVLVGLALYNVLGLSDDNTSIKSALPKIIIGIIAVNFSFVAIKVVLDGVNVMTTAVFALPDQVGTGLSNIDTTADQSRLCAALEGTAFSQFDSQPDESIKTAKELSVYRSVGQSYKDDIIAKTPAGQDPNIVLDTDSIDQVKQKIAAYDASSGSPGTIQKEFDKKIATKLGSDLCTGKNLNDNGKLFLSHYNSRNAAFALALNMGKIVFYQDVDPKLLDNKGDAYEKLFTNTLFSMILYVVYCASFIALFIVLLGRLVVMWLSIAISPILLLMLASSQVKEKLGGLGKIAEQFTKNAIAPLLISLSMTVGWIMLKAVQGLDIGSQAGSFISNSVFKINPTNGVPVASLNTLQDFMVALGVIAVVWLGVFSAAEGTIAQGATDWIKDKVQTAGKFVGSLPFKHLPLIPIDLPGHPHEHYTFSQLGHYIENLTHGNENKLTEFAGGKKNADETNLREMKDQAGLTNWLKNNKDGKNDLQDPKYRPHIAKWLKDHHPEVQKMETGTADQRALIGNLKKLAAAKNDKAGNEEAEKLKEAINNNDLVFRASGEIPAPGATPPAKPGAKPKPGEKPAAPAPTVTKGDAVGEKLAIAGEPPATTDSRIAAVVTSKNNIDTTIKKPLTTDAAKLPAEQEAQKATIKKQVKAIGAAFKQAGKGLPDNAGLRQLFGENYDKVEAACGGAGGLIDTLNNPTPPPAGPTPPRPAATP